jgi:hypothetical protein
VSRRKSRGWQAPLPPGPGRATVEQCEELHGLLCDVLLEAVRHMQSSGKVNRGLVSVCIDFLRMAEVTSPAITDRKRDELVELMPDFDSLH